MLSKFKPGERKSVEEAVATAAQAALVWLRQGTEAAMNRFNGGEDGGKEKGKTRKEKGEDGGQKKAEPKEKPTGPPTG